MSKSKHKSQGTLHPWSGTRAGFFTTNTRAASSSQLSRLKAHFYGGGSDGYSNKPCLAKYKKGSNANSTAKELRPGRARGIILEPPVLWGKWDIENYPVRHNSEANIWDGRRSLTAWGNRKYLVLMKFYFYSLQVGNIFQPKGKIDNPQLEGTVVTS